MNSVRELRDALKLAQIQAECFEILSAREPRRISDKELYELERSILPRQRVRHFLAAGSRFVLGLRLTDLSIGVRSSLTSTSSSTSCGCKRWRSLRARAIHARPSSGRTPSSRHISNPDSTPIVRYRLRVLRMCYTRYAQTYNWVD